MSWQIGGLFQPLKRLKHLTTKSWLHVITDSRREIFHFRLEPMQSTHDQAEGLISPAYHVRKGEESNVEDGHVLGRLALIIDTIQV